MDLVTTIGLVLAQLGIGFTLLFVVWQPKRQSIRVLIGSVGVFTIFAGIIVLVGFAPIRWRSPIVLRSPILEQTALASATPTAAPPATESTQSALAQVGACRGEKELKTKLESAERRVALLQGVANKLSRCEDVGQDLKNQRQDCVKYKQKVVDDIGYLLDRNYVGDLLAAKGDLDAANADADAAGEEMNSHTFNQAPYREKYGRAIQQAQAAQNKLNDLRTALENTLLKLAGRPIPSPRAN
jgi:uncharacterized membrane protein (Fun14 family)